MTDSPEPPLYVDLDGTLIRGDTLLLSLMKLLRERPWRSLVLPYRLLAGRAALKDYIARSVSLEPAELPYRIEVLDFLRSEKARGRTLVLATAAHSIISDAVAGHLRLFDRVLATDRSRNLKGEAKLAAVVGELPDGLFDYVGDSMADLPLFRKARFAILVRPSPKLLRAARATCRVGRVFE